MLPGHVIDASSHASSLLRFEEAAADEWRTAYVQRMRHVPGPVAVIAAASGAARGGLTATAWSSLCADPPMLLVCINRHARAHSIILEAGAFSINLLSQEQAETAAIFGAQRDLTGADRFLDEHWMDGARGQPILKAAVAAFECALEQAHDHGTHSILIGQVKAMSQAGHVGALLYCNGSFGSFGAADFGARR